jgi:hypothetical protein
MSNLDFWDVGVFVIVFLLGLFVGKIVYQLHQNLREKGSVDIFGDAQEHEYDSKEK